MAKTVSSYAEAAFDGGQMQKSVLRIDGMD